MEIENRLRRVLDVARNDDQARNRKGHCAENLALLWKLALNLARLEASKGSMRGKLKWAGWDDGFLISILSQFTKIHMRWPWRQTLNLVTRPNERGSIV